MTLDVVVNPRIDNVDIERERDIIQRERVRKETPRKNDVMYPIKVCEDTVTPEKSVVVTRNYWY